MFSTMFNWITSVIAHLFESVLVWLLGVVPNNALLENSFNVDISSMDATLLRVSHTIAQFNVVFPFDTLMLLFQLFLVAEMVLFLLALFITLVKLIFLAK